MARPLKYLEGPPILSLNELHDQLKSGRYIIDARTGQRVHPGWAESWQLRMAAASVERGLLLRAIPNPDHPDNKETT
jgi:hypothetical protein